MRDQTLSIGGDINALHMSRQTVESHAWRRGLRDRQGNSAKNMCSYHTCQKYPTILSLRTNPSRLSIHLKSEIDLLGILTKSLCPLLQLVDTVNQLLHRSYNRL